jgi:hypothetical protein
MVRMAARRLIILMLVLLAISTVVAIVTPDPADRADDSGATGATGTTATGGTGATGATGSTGATGTTGGAGAPERTAGAGADTIEKTVRVPDGEGMQTVTVRPGARVVLTVEADRTVVVAVAGFGLDATATRFAPAVFDLVLPDEAGTWAVTELDNGRAFARLVAESDGEAAAGGRDAGQGEGDREPASTG